MELISRTKTDALGNSVFVCTFNDDSGTVVEKTISFEDYLKILGASATEKKERRRIGKLPSHYLDAALDENSFQVLLFYPAEKRTIVFGRKHWRVPFPNLLFDFTIENGTKKSARCFALGTDCPDADSLLFCYPFGNVNQSGEICYGNIDTGEVTLETVESLVEDFFMGETNNDYYGDGGNLELPKLRQEVLLEKLTHMDAFPCEWLKESSCTKKVVGKLIN